jgi:hypothetical protein
MLKNVPGGKTLGLNKVRPNKASAIPTTLVFKTTFAVFR